MKKVTRLPLNPDCLSRYNHVTDKWRSKSEPGLPRIPSEADREQLWEEFNRMQHNNCAYCEAALDARSHIEHFAKREARPDLTFEWTNLFGSCSRQDCCGHFKDSQHSNYSSYRLQDLIKPDDENPWDYLVFGSDGRVSVRDGISSTARKKGQTTIDVLNLNAPHHIPERISRYGLISQLLPFLEELTADEFFSICEEEIHALLPYLSTYTSAAFQHLPPQVLCRFS